MFTAANYTPDLLFGAIDCENITDSGGFVTECLFQVIYVSNFNRRSQRRYTGLYYDFTP